MLEETTPTFDAHFEKFYAAHLVRDSSFLDHVAPDVAPEMFPSEIVQRLVRVVLAFYEAERIAPDELIYHQLKTYKADGILPEEAYDELVAYLERLFELDLRARPYILKHHNKFVRQQRLRAALPDVVEMTNKGRIEEAEHLLHEVFTYRPDRQEAPGMRYGFDNVSERVMRRYEEEGERFWLLMEEVDQHIDGLRRGELGVWQSQRSSVGKTAALVHCAKAFIFQDRRVLIFTTEESEDEYQDRLDQSIAGLTKYQLTQREEIERAVRRVTKNRGDSLWIKKVTGNTTVNDLRKHKTLLESRYGFTPDAILIDYADELEPENKRLYGGSSYLHLAGKEVYKSLHDWAEEDEIAMWTASASKKEAMEVDKADMNMAGGSSWKVNISDLWISINRSSAELAEGLTTLFVVKNRQGAARFSITIHSDLPRQLFWRHAPADG